MIHYILQIVVYQLLFLTVYDLFLKKETFFNWNRVYLLIAPILSFLLPLIKLDIIRQHIPPAYTIQLPEILITNSPMQIHLLPEVSIGTKTGIFNFVPLIGNIWYLGLGISILLFVYKLFKIIQLKKSGTRITIDTIHLISLPNTTTAFSFFNTIFIGTNLSEVKKTNVLLHEKIHVKERHTLDLLFFEVLRIILWFNPLIYTYQKRITTLQEYIADAKAIAETSKKEYYQDLLSQVFQTDRISFVNTFFNHSLIKKRIIMLQKSKSKKIFQLKYLLLIPVIAVMLAYSSCTEDTNVANDFSSSSKSEILKGIENLKDAIAKQGNMTDEEQKELKTLLLLTSENGFKEPFFADVVDNAEIPFAVIEQVPIFPGCENLSQKEAKECFSKNVSQLVGAEFDTGLAKDLNLKGVQRIYVRFKIDNKGTIADIEARAPLPELEKEAIRVMNKLPQMTPGVQGGVNVGVLYALPIAFDIKE